MTDPFLETSLSQFQLQMSSDDSDDDADEEGGVVGDPGQGSSAEGSGIGTAEDPINLD